MEWGELRNQPLLLFPKAKDEVYFADKDHVWINGRQYISLKRVGEMMKEKRMTNADRIRAMSDEELASLLQPICPPIPRCPDEPPHNCRMCVFNWLRQEATNDQNNS